MSDHELVPAQEVTPVEADPASPLGNEKAEAMARRLAEGMSVTEAAKAGGVSESTVYRWLDRGELTRRSLYLSKQLLLLRCGKAGEVVGELMDTAESEAVRLKAASTILSGSGLDQLSEGETSQRGLVVIDLG